MCRKTTYVTQEWVHSVLQAWYGELSRADFAYLKQKLLLFLKSALAPLSRTCNVSTNPYDNEEEFPDIEYDLPPNVSLYDQLPKLEREARRLTLALRSKPSSIQPVKDYARQCEHNMDMSIDSLFKNLRANFAVPHVSAAKLGGTPVRRRRLAQKNSHKRKFTPKKLTPGKRRQRSATPTRKR